MLTLTALGFFGVPPASANEGNLTKWEKHCANSTFVTQRTGRFHTGEIEKGMRVLHQSGILNSVMSFGNQEACLSFVASAAVEFPVVVLEKRLPKDDKQWSQAVVNRLSDFVVRELIAERLTEAEINIRQPVPLTKKTQKRRTLSDNRAVLFGTNQDRSYSAAGPGACLVATHPTSMTSDLPTQNPYVWSLIGDSEKESLAQIGDPMEFWHEVAHCQPEYALNDLAANDGSASEMKSWATRRNKEAQACRPEVGDALLSQMHSQLESHSDNPTKALNNTLKAGGFNKGDMQDYHTHWRLLFEALSDAWAKKQVEARGVYSARHCGADQLLPHPWDRLRLAWSIREPDARYMTWLMPWVEGYPETTQYQVLADAYEGMIRAAEDLLPKAVYLQMITERESRPDLYGLGTPKREPDNARAESWRQWANHHRTMDSLL